MFVLAGSLTSVSEGQGIPGEGQRWGLLGGAQGGEHQRENVLRDAGLSGQPSGSVGRDREFRSLVVQHLWEREESGFMDADEGYSN